MSTDRRSGSGGIDGDDGLDDRFDEVLRMAEELASSRGPLLNSGDPGEVEQLVYRMFEAVGGRRVPIDSNGEELVVEADADDSNWRKQTEVPTFRAECGPFHVTGPGFDLGEAEESFLEVVPNGQEDGRVCVDSNLRGEFEGLEHEQGALHMLTPRQARSFAAALLEQAAYVEDLEADR
jgi:hypothetical protein